MTAVSRSLVPKKAPKEKESSAAKQAEAELQRIH